MKPFQSSPYKFNGTVTNFEWFYVPSEMHRPVHSLARSCTINIHISTEKVTKQFYNVWISRFGVPQFAYYKSLKPIRVSNFILPTKVLGFHKIRTSLYPKGLV
ncbi:hypothetical protein CEXT_309821 [Caerostris extrusa]|uniref:Uncharacterized protein n=1 Tax=Caerostris extrusa TaxID=172846 RepID=A0AAV4UGA7_CAEEX|nr:hypothetical protein CEXT_309821 [Caerostris extrusa]